jgi:hypothetical protein
VAGVRSRLGTSNRGDVAMNDEDVFLGAGAAAIAVISVICVVVIATTVAAVW